MQYSDTVVKSYWEIGYQLGDYTLATIFMVLHFDNHSCGCRTGLQKSCKDFKKVEKNIKVQFKDGNCDHVHSCLSKKLTDAKISQVRVTLIDQLV